MSKSGYDETDMRKEIEACNTDPRASEIGYETYSVKTKVKEETLIFRHLTPEANPDAWVTAREGSWVDIETYGSSEYTKRKSE